MFHTKVAEKIKTHFVFNFFRKSRRLPDMWESVAEPDRPQMTTIWRMRAYDPPSPAGRASARPLTRTKSEREYAILIAFPRQICQRERPSLPVFYCRIQWRMFLHAISASTAITRMSTQMRSSTIFGQTNLPTDGRFMH
jgi:hypothetical protein